MEIEFSGHALQRMRQRSVTKDEVRESKAQNTLKIITVIDTSKVDKYL